LIYSSTVNICKKILALAPPLPPKVCEKNVQWCDVSGPHWRNIRPRRQKRKKVAKNLPTSAGEKREGWPSVSTVPLHCSHLCQEEKMIYSGPEQGCQVEIIAQKP